MANIQVETEFMKQIVCVRDKIKESFQRSHASLAEREESLLSRVNTIEREYSARQEEIQREMESLTKARSLNADTLTSNTLITTRNEVYASIDRKIAELTAGVDSSIEFEWDSLFETDIEQLGSIKLNDKTSKSLARTFPPRVKPVVPDYKAKQLPTAYCCKKSSQQKAPGEINGARAIAVSDTTGNIYIADRDNNRIQVLSCNGDFLFMFSGDMKQPRGICIHSENVFVTQMSGSCVNKYKLDGTLLKSVGIKGIGTGQFDRPHCLDISPYTHRLYVCDTNNRRVQILSEDLTFHSLLGVGMFYSPIDVKVSRERVLVLDESDPCMFVFTSNHVLINRLLTRGYAKQTNNPRFFDIDREHSIILSDYKDNCICVYTQEGECVHRIGRGGRGWESSIGQLV